MACSAPLTLGFVGVGTINAACVRGLIASGLTSKIVLSPRGREVQALLSEHPEQVTVAGSNQAVVDAATLIFVAVSQKAECALAELTFGPEHTLVSLMAGVSQGRVAELARVEASQVVLAVPLPGVATLNGASLVSPAHPVVVALFDRLGVAVALEDPTEMLVMMCVTCCMGDFYARQLAISQWLQERGVAEAAAEQYVGAIFVTVALDSKAGRFVHHVGQQTPGGLNEMVIGQQRAAGSYDALQASLVTVLARLRGQPCAPGKPEQQQRRLGSGDEATAGAAWRSGAALAGIGLAGVALGAGVAAWALRR